ncbi:MAG TPA: hypothetical protein VLG50_06500 [Candidatus Saccharimonadales bacterium]|nr:hypothetical protein [Candidatus Saccharimonadales bacterium]
MSNNDDEIRYDAAHYHQATDEEKDALWMKDIHRHYKDVGFKERVRMEFASLCVDYYLKAQDNEKDILYDCFSEVAKIYCNKKKWRAEQHDREEVLMALRCRYPGCYEMLSGYRIL